jgi:molybdopterin-containing oxidoreductase family membrane subunit
MEEKDKIEEQLLSPLKSYSRRYYLMVVFLLSIIAFGLFNWIKQLISGLGVTGLNSPVFWGVYITNYVFFIGISHAGTLISAILRLIRAEWRRPFTRAAEAITVFSLPFGACSVIVDMGRPDRLLNVIKHGRIQSPILWDITAISTYLISSCIFFYICLIPDIAICRDRLTEAGKFRKKFYSILALGWQDTEEQQRLLNKIIAFFSVFLTLLVITVHTVVSWIFGMTIQPGWHSAAIGPYFVIGAIFSGVAAVVIVVTILRKIFKLEEFIKPIHYDNLGKFLLALTLLWFYFTVAEFLTTAYGREPAHMSVFNAKFFGEYALLFWLMVILCFAVPLIILVRKKTRTIPGLIIASIAINIGMWIERYLVVIPSLARPRVSYPQGTYTASGVEWSITLAFFAGLMLLYLIFSKLLPVISIWEIKEGKEKAVDEMTERLKEYSP